MPKPSATTVLTGEITATGSNEHGQWMDALVHDKATGRDYEIRLSAFQLPPSQLDQQAVGERVHVTLPENMTIDDGAEALAASRVRIVGRLGAMAREDLLAQADRLRAQRR
jgi:hypothetical protein